VSRKVVRLTLDHLATLRAGLAAPCASCLTWQLSPVARSAIPAAEHVAIKEAWVSEVLREWGSCGRIALVEDQPVGLAIYAPPAFLPGAASIPTAPVSADAVLLASVWVHPAYIGGGVGRMLIQGTARDLSRRGDVTAVEAFGSLSGPGSRRACVLPADFLGRVGFKTHRPHPTTPRMRMDLRTAVAWRSEVEAALERLVGVVRPGLAGAPAPGEARQLN
jgi:GNAT superfamily N-acetyltransferase